MALSVLMAVGKHMAMLSPWKARNNIDRVSVLVRPEVRVKLPSVKVSRRLVPRLSTIICHGAGEEHTATTGKSAQLLCLYEAIFCTRGWGAFILASIPRQVVKKHLVLDFLRVQSER